MYDMKVIRVRIRNALFEELDRRSKGRGVPLDRFAREAIERFLRLHEFRKCRREVVQLAQSRDVHSDQDVFDVLDGSDTPSRGIVERDLLGLYRDGQPDDKRIADLLKLSKSELAKLTGVAKASVRRDIQIPIPVVESLREIANLANLVAEYFSGDANKVSVWFAVANPLLGNVSPRDMIRGGRYHRLLSFVLDAREAERAAAGCPTSED
jgi:hypothetical protein